MAVLFVLRDVTTGGVLAGPAGTGATEKVMDAAAKWFGRDGPALQEAASSRCSCIPRYSSPIRLEPLPSGEMCLTRGFPRHRIQRHSSAVIATKLKPVPLKPARQIPETNYVVVSNRPPRVCKTPQIIPSDQIVRARPAQMLMERKARRALRSLRYRMLTFVAAHSEVFIILVDADPPAIAPLLRVSSRADFRER